MSRAAGIYLILRNFGIGVVVGSKFERNAIYKTYTLYLTFDFGSYEWISQGYFKVSSCSSGISLVFSPHRAKFSTLEKSYNGRYKPTDFSDKSLTSGLQSYLNRNYAGIGQLSGDKSLKFKYQLTNFKLIHLTSDAVRLFWWVSVLKCEI